METVRRLTHAGTRFTVEEIPVPDWDFWALWESGQWEPETFVVLDRFLEPASTYVDLGAWVGPTVLHASRRCARVVAVEPDPAALRVLRWNLGMNPGGEVTVVEAAVVGSAGRVALYPRGGWGSSMSTVLPTGSDDVCYVDGITFDELVAGLEDVALVKMDIEGGEVDVLDGTASWCCANAVPLVVSLHEPWWPAGGRQTVDGALARFGRLETIASAPGGFSTILAEP